MPRPLIAFAIALLASLFALFGRGALRSMDDFCYDVGLTARATRVPQDITILGIDEDFMKGRHPYLAPRDRIAKLVRNLAAAKPKAIAVDVWFDSRIDDGPKGVDTQLKSALSFARERGIPVLLSDLPPDQNDFARDSSNGQNAHGSVLPYFSDEARTGSVFFMPDEGGVVRWHPRDKRRRPSLTAQMAVLGGATQDNLLGMQLLNRPLDYDGPPGTIKKEKAVDFLDPNIAPLLNGQLIFIGATYPGSRDLLYTPYSRQKSKPMYGVELLAQATDDIRRGPVRFSHETNRAVMRDFRFVLLAAFLVTLAALRGTLPGISAALGLIGVAAVCAVLSARDVTPWWGSRFHPLAPFLLALPLSAGGGIAWRSIIEGRELRRVRDTFGAYVGSAVLESLGGKMPELGGETRPIAVLFCDIRGYSALAESMSNDPKALLDELNAHFAPLVAALQKRGAYVDNYVGDLVMALFGAPVSSGSYQTDVRAAVLAALDFVSIVEARNVGRRAKGLFPIEVGIGVHCGEAVVGNMGTTDAQAGGKIHYTAIGDVVNVASRIESATRGQNVALLVTREVVEACGQGEELPPWERIGEVNVKGRAAAVEIFKVGE